MPYHVQVQELPLTYWDPAVLLPVVIEHTIDERSPLYGHTSQTLEVRLAGGTVILCPVSFVRYPAMCPAALPRVDECMHRLVSVSIIRLHGSLKH